MNHRANTSTLESILWLARVGFLILIIFIVFFVFVNPHIHRKVNLLSLESSLLVSNILSCLEKDHLVQPERIDTNLLESCLHQKNYGVKLTYRDREAIVHRTIYNERFYCKFKTHYCAETSFPLNDGLLMIDLVIKQ